MEKIAAVCAMDWSIELEKGLRSRKPGHLIESINSMGPKLKQWSRDPQLTMAVYDMYGLVPGEDRLFADAILLRLADTFVSGDNVIKKSVIRVFVLSLRHCRAKEREARGIFSNMGEEIRLELLRRIKVVLTSEKEETRALALILLGCCAEIAKDVAEMRHYVLSTLSSCHILEVKASLFAVGCFSEISDDFGFVCLESVLKLMNSPKTLPALRVAGARTFSKMGCTLLLAFKSYKAGAELARKTLEEDILSTMLISLTKLSLKAMILISGQVGLLSSFLTQETSSRLQATALKCIRIIAEKAACFLPTSAFPYMDLFRMLDELNIPSASCDEVLEILLKMVAYGLPDMLLNDFDLFNKLLRYVEDAIHSPLLSTRLLSFQILVCVSNKLKGRDDLLLEANPATFPSGVVISISDHIALLLRLLPGGEVVQELRSLLKLLLVLAKNHSDVGFLILEKIHFIFKNMENLQNKHSPAMNSEIHTVAIPAANQNFTIHEVMYYIFRFLMSFIETLDGVVASSNDIVCRLKELISVVCNSSLFDCSTHILFSLLLRSLVNSNLLPSESQTTNFVQGQSGYPCNFLESEVDLYKCAKNMLEGRDNWWAYKSGCYAACEGEWYVASFMFEHLETRVQSDIKCQWLNFLVQFTRNEKNVKLLSQQMQSCLPYDHSVVQFDMHICPVSTISSDYIEKLVDTCSNISLSGKILDSLSFQTQTCCFQRWLLALRQKVLLVLVDLLKFLNVFLDLKDGESIFQKIKGLISSLSGLSARLASVVEEFDLISTSFADLDSKNLRVISALGFSCSVLAFSTEFTHLIVNLLIPDILTKESRNQQSRIMEDFASRLWHIDSDMCFALMSFLKQFRRHERRLPFQSGFSIPKVGILSKDIITLCRYSVGHLISLRNECSNVNNEDKVCEVYKNSMQLLSNIVGTWMHIPFRIPKYFFRVRPSVGCLLMSISSGSRKQDETFVLHGSQLALNLCIQLKNMTSDVSSRFSVIYCILSCRTSLMGTRHGGQICGEGWMHYQPSEIDIMIELNRKLKCQVLRQSKESMISGDYQSDDDLVETCVCFKTNGGTQGFSTCLLDVSAFPVGSYRIQWLCGGVDHQGTYWNFLPLNPCPQFNVIE